MTEKASALAPCPSERGSHTWLCLSIAHGPDALYGCQHCPATAAGSEIGVTRQQRYPAEVTA